MSRKACLTCKPPPKPLQLERKKEDEKSRGQQKKTKQPVKNAVGRRSRDGEFGAQTQTQTRS
jgi:hypothetical protein